MVIHFSKTRKSKTACGSPADISKVKTSNRTKVTCSRCLVSLESKDRKLDAKRQKGELDKIEKRAMALWHHIVWLLWGKKCALCGNGCDSKNAHHYFTQGVHGAIKFEPDNGAQLCYPCHIHRIHKGIDHEKLRDKMIEKIGEERFSSLKSRSWDLADNSREYLEAVEETLKGYVSELQRNSNGRV